MRGRERASESERGRERDREREKEREREREKERERERRVTSQSSPPIDPRTLVFTLTPTTSLSYIMYQ